MELPGRRRRRRPKRIFLDVVKGDMQLVDAAEEIHKRGKMETDDLLWQLLKVKAMSKSNQIQKQYIKPYLLNNMTE